MLVWLLSSRHHACLNQRPASSPLLPTAQGLGSGFGVVKIGSRQFVRSMPTELSTDSNTLIELAQVGGVRSVECVLQLRVQWLHGPVVCACSTWWFLGLRHMGALGRCVNPTPRYLSCLLASSFTAGAPRLPALPLVHLAQRLGGYFALADAVASTGWQEERVGALLQLETVVSVSHPGVAVFCMALHVGGAETSHEWLRA